MTRKQAKVRVLLPSLQKDTAASPFRFTGKMPASEAGRGRSIINVHKPYVPGTEIWKRSFALPAHPIHAEQFRPRAMLNLQKRAALIPTREQTWPTPAPLMAGHFNQYRQYEPGVIGIGTQPQFAIGQRALVVCTPNGNVLWDCIA